MGASVELVVAENGNDVASRWGFAMRRGRRRTQEAEDVGIQLGPPSAGIYDRK